MKFARKLIAALIVAICMVLSGLGWFLMHREENSFAEDIRDHHELIAATLAGSVEMVWRNRGAERALALIREADRLREHVRVRWIWIHQDQGERSPLAAAERLQSLQPHQYIHIQERLTRASAGLQRDSNGEPWLVTYHAIGTPEGRVGAIEVAESLRRQRDKLHADLVSIVFTTVLLIVICAVLVFMLGIWFVGRPLDKLAGKARRVGSGDLGTPLVLRQKDEFGELANEMNAMCERLAEANARVRTETEARIAAIERLRHADRLRTLGQLSAGVAHELGTPLNIVLGRAKMIARAKAAPEKIMEYANMIAEQAERMTRIIRQLLDYARIRQSKVTREDLSRLTTQAVELLNALADKRNVRLRVAAAAPVSVDIDAVQLQQAMTNIVVNAIQASPAGGIVSISTGTESRPRDGTSGAGAEYAFFRVQDEGEGMTEATLNEVFEPFFTTKPIGEGTGLGLALTRDIINEHRGFIAAESRPQAGSVFTVYLPTAAS